MSVEFGAAGNKPAPWGQGNYKSMSYWSKSNKGTSCTLTNPNVMNSAAKSGQWAFNALQPDTTYTEEDYKALGALIDSVRAQAMRV